MKAANTLRNLVFIARLSPVNSTLCNGGCMKKLHVAASPLTGTIFCGSVLKDGRTWAANKQDVTIDALVAVA